jgi:large repetitive protein
VSLDNHVGSQTSRRRVAMGSAIVVAGASVVVLSPASSASAATPTRDVWVVTAPTTAATTQAVTIARLTPDGSAAGEPISLPTAASDATKAFTLGGTETNTGVLARSLDGKRVTLAGYAVAPGSSVSSSAPRGVAVIDAGGAVDTTTTLSGALIKSAVRGAVTSDGTGVWASGDGDDSSPKRSVVYQPLGGTTTPSQLWSSDDDQYKKKGGPIKAYGGSFWFASDNKSALYKVVGAPDTPTSATLTTVGSTTALDYAFVDRDASVPGVDTLYVAVAAGIEKWTTANGTSWTKVGTSALAGTRSIDARSAGDRTEIFAVVGTAAANTLHRITDTGAPGAAAVLSDTTIATAAAGTSFRGVAFAPAADGAAPDSAGTTPTVTVTPPSGASVGDTVTYSAAVASGSGNADGGAVTFYDGTTVLGTAPVGAGGIASLSTTQSVGGSRSITAWYSGSDSLLPTRSAAVTATIGRLAVTTTVAPDALTADYSAAATALTVTVAGVGGSSVTPTGTVTLTEAGTTVGTGTLASGTVKISLTALAAGSHSLVATYSGNDSFAPSDSTPVSVTITPAATTTVLTSSTTTVALGSALSTSVTVANSVNTSSTYRATGTVDLLENGTTVASGTLSSGSASVSIPAAVLTTGVHTFTARYNAGTNHAGSTTATPLTVTVASSTVSALTVTPSSGTIYLGQQQVTVTGTVTGLPAGGAAPTGIVELRSGTTALTQVQLNATGGFSVTLPADQAAGSYSLVASYSGDTNYTASQSATKSLTITAGGSTVTTSASLALSAPGVAPGDPVRATATVSNGTNTTALVGYVRFSVDGVAVGDAKLTATSPATTPPTATAFVDLDTNLAEGGHTVTAKYLGAGTSSSAGFKSSEAAPATLQLEAAAAVDTVVTIDQPTTANPVTYGSANSVTVRVAPVEGSKTVTGTVQLRDGATVIATGLLTGGAFTASIASLLPGSHSLTASYLATGSFNAGQSTTPVTVKVDPATTATTLTLTTSAVLYGTALKPKITVTNASGTGVVPTGTVSILEGTTVLGTGTLVSGTVTLTLPTTLTSGAHRLHAVYTPSDGFAASESATDVDATVVGTKITSTGLSPSEFYIGSARPTVTFTVSSLEPGRGIPTGVVAVYTSSTATTAALLGYGSLDAAGRTTITLSAELPRSGASVSDDKLKYKSIVASYSGVGTANPTEDLSASVGGRGDDDDDESLEVKFKGSAVATSTTLSLSNADLGPEETTSAHIEVSSTNGVAPAGGYVQILVDSGAYGTPTELMPACFTAEYCEEFQVSAAGTADVSLPAFDAGEHVVTARYLAYQSAKSATYYGASTIGAENTVTLHVDGTKSATQVALSAPNVEVGTSSVATVLVDGSGGTPSGTVEVYEGSTVVASGQLADGRAELDLGTLTIGLHPLKARYVGTAKYEAADSAQVQHSVFGHPVEVSVTAPEACTAGAACTVGVLVEAEAGTPVGTVRLLEDGRQLASAPYSGTATTLATPTSWAAGTHEVTVVFSPTSEHAAGSADVSVDVAKGTPLGTTATLVLSRATTTYGTAIKATVKVTSAGGVPTGKVTVLDGTTALTTLTLVKGAASATLPASLGAGKHRLTVRYGAGDGFAGSTSSASVLTVAKASVKTRVKVSKGSIAKGRSVTVTVTATAAGATPTGVVRLYDGSRYLGRATLKGGKATFKLAKLGRGAHRLTVRYVGGANAAPSTSAAATVKVR